MHVASMVMITQATAPIIASIALAEVLAEAREKHGELPPIVDELVKSVENRIEKIMVEFAEGIIAGTGQ